MPARHVSLGDLLVSRGVLDQIQLAEALAEHARTHQRIGEILCGRGWIRDTDLIQALAQQLSLRLFDPTQDRVEPAAAEVIPHEVARRYGVIPLRATPAKLTVAMSDPLDVMALDALRGLARREVEVLLAPAETIARLRDRHYGQVEGNRGVERAVQEAAIVLGATAREDEELDEDEAKRRALDAPIVKLVEQILSQALQERATDIHVEPTERALVIRYRIDGMLNDALTPPRSVFTGLVSRIKILAQMDIAERRAPQDGRFTTRADGRDVDVRVSAIPTIHGEKLVLRLLNKSTFDFDLRAIGLEASEEQAFRHAIHQPYGMILVSGPTGSGKSTTLYSSLLELRDETRNVVTVEDPVEYQIGRVNQVQVNERKRLTFSTALRSFLRQDPDVIMVGEIRDQETAELAVRAALTGHLVLSTIHANDACATATRLVSMGVEPFQAASVLSLVAAQRLVRRSCSYCLVDYEPSAELLSALTMRRGDEALAELRGIRFRRGAGCAECRQRGYLGRVAIFELLSLTPSLRNLVAESRPADVVRRAAIAAGMKTLRQAGLEKVRAGTTTIEEVLRVCLDDE